MTARTTVHSPFYSPPTFSRSMRAYHSFLSEGETVRLRAASRALAGSTIIHVNTAASSGGVAEMLRSQIPIERSLGLDARWLVMRGPESFFEVTKKIHHALQGGEYPLTEEEQSLYLRHVHSCALAFQAYVRTCARPIIVLHDPQPLPLIGYVAGSAPVIVRIHPDLTTPQKEVLSFLRPLISQARMLLVSDAGYRPRWFPAASTRVVFPAIDPVSEKNRTLSKRTQRIVMQRAGIDPDRPLVTQISRIDPWKDPLGVIAAYRMAKKEYPALQLAIVGINLRGRRSSGEEALYEAVAAEATKDSDIHLFGEKEPPGGYTNDVFVNVMQRASSVVVQKSLREGFGMSLTEAMWKGAAVIGGRSTGIRHQIRNGQNGYVVDSVEECAEKISMLLADRGRRERMGQAALCSVRAHFLIPRLIREHLEAYAEVAHVPRLHQFSISPLVQSKGLKRQ